MSIREINRFFLLACAPFIGMLIWLMASQWTIPLSFSAAKPLEGFSLASQAVGVDQSLEKARNDAVAIQGTIEKTFQQYQQSAADMNGMLLIANAQVTRPEAIFENRVSAQLGKPTRSISSNNIDLKLYQYNDPNYRGYALKVKLKTDNAMKMALAKDKIGNSETTLDAVKRMGAVAGVNAGGFADDSGGRRYPLSNTIQNGKFVYGFEPSHDNLAFVGLSTERKLIGGRFSSQSDLDKLKPSFGATFVPILLQQGQKQIIPAQWQNSPKRAPRTVIGNFSNDQLLVLVADGYDERGGSGATLMELQDRLAALRVRDAYNLDGGGSSSLVVEGQVINKPSDGRLRLLPTNFLFFK